MGAVRNYLEPHPGDSGIIYCLTKQVEREVCMSAHKGAEVFCDPIPCWTHPDGDEDAIREDFLYDRAQILVEAITFGMELTNPMSRFVLHYGMKHKSLSCLVQMPFLITFISMNFCTIQAIYFDN